jgi:hypothetical protein
VPHYIPADRLATVKNAGSLLSRSPQQLRQLPADIHHGLVAAFVRSFDEVLLWAVPLAAAAFLITWLLREHPLRDTVHVVSTAEAAADGGTRGASLQPEAMHVL